MSNPNLSAYVADHLRACQLKQLSILEEVDRICKKHGIGYWLDGGSPIWNVLKKLLRQNCPKLFFYRHAVVIPLTKVLL